MNRQADERDRRADELIDQMLKEQRGNTSTKTPQAGQTPTPETAKQEHREDMQQKFNVLKGKYEAEVPRLHQQNKQLLSDLREVEAENDRLKQQLQSQSSESNQQTSRSEALNKLREDFGDDLADSVMGLIRENTQAQRQEPAPQQEQQTQSRADQYDFQQRMARVADLVGGQAEFDRIDNNPQFTHWLKQYDTQYGRIRHEALNDFFSKGYEQETANFYLKWRREQEAASQSNPLEEHVQPNSVSNDGPAPEQQPTYTRSEWHDLWKSIQTDPIYRESREGIAEGEAIERELEAAAREGRVIG